MGVKFSKRSFRRYNSQRNHGSSRSFAVRGGSLGSGYLRDYPPSCLSMSRRFLSLEQLNDALEKAGVESSNLIVGIDFTKSNEWTGKFSFDRRCLHDLDFFPNPYEKAISIIGKTLSFFNEENLIPCFGFGDASTHDKSVFSFTSNGKPCKGFSGVLQSYRKVVSSVQLAGPTSFAPIIEAAMNVVDDSGGQYHILLVIADGQVTHSSSNEHGHLSAQEKATINAIVKASDYPLSIIVVGVGDGPWDTMMDFSNCIPSRKFDNIQFVNFTEIMARDWPESRKETEFALTALKKIPYQHQAIIDLQLLGRHKGASGRKSQPLSVWCRDKSRSMRKDDKITDSSFQNSHEISMANVQRCPVCLCNQKNLALGCGHQTCSDCGEMLKICPICRSGITIKIRLYD